MEQQTKTNITNVDIWIRLLYMILFGMMLMVARMVIWVTAVLQFLLVLMTGSDNLNLRNLGQGVSKWSLQAFLYLTFNSDEKPFPFSDWPEITEPEEPEVIVAAETVNDARDIPTFTATDRVEEQEDAEEKVIGEQVISEQESSPESSDNDERKE